MNVQLIRVSPQVAARIPHLDNFLQYALDSLHACPTEDSTELVECLKSSLSRFGSFHISYLDPLTATAIEFPGAEELVHIVIDTEQHEVMRYH